MRVVHVITNLDRGGAQVSVALIASGLRRRGIDVHVVFSSRGGMMPTAGMALSDELARDGVPLHDVPAMRRAPIGEPFPPELKAYLDHRMEEIKAGRAETVPHDEAMALHREIAAAYETMSPEDRARGVPRTLPHRRT